MKVNRISTISAFTKRVNSPKIQKEQVETNNNFEFSHLSSAALKTSLCSNISFKGSTITLSELNQKETEVRLAGIQSYYNAQSILNVVAPQAQMAADQMYSMVMEALKDCEDNSNVDVEYSIENGKIVPKEMTFYDAFKTPFYKAKFMNGKLSEFNSYKPDGKIAEIVKYSVENGNVVSYKNGYDETFGEFASSFEFALDENGKNKLTKYTENYQKLVDPDGGLYSKNIEYDGDKVIFEEHVRVMGMARKIKIGKSFKFQDDRNFTFQNGYEVCANGSVLRGETLTIKDGNITKFDKGYSKFADGSEVQEPIIILDAGKVVEYDEGYQMSARGILTKGNCIKMQGGIPFSMLQALGLV